MKTFKVTYIDGLCLKYLRINDEWDTLMHNLARKLDLESIINIEVVMQNEGV